MQSKFVRDIVDGRLKRLPFFGFFLLLGVVLLFTTIGVTVLVTDIQYLKERVPEWLTLAFGGFTVVAIGAWTFSLLNIHAMRFRDIGLPGWWSVLAMNVLLFSVAGVASDDVASSVYFLIVVGSLLIPTETIKIRRNLEKK